MKEILESKGYKPTPARIAILDIFIENDLPLNVETVYRKVKRNNLEIDEVTVYRTIATLENGRILRKVDLRKDSAYFELRARHHHHVVCTNCETIEDFENSEVEEALRRVVENSSQIKSQFKVIKEHSLELFGLCKNCA